MAANPQSTQDWLKAFYAAADALDARSWVETYWTDDAELQFAGVPVAKGRGEVEAFFAQRFSELKSMRHAITTIDVLLIRFITEQW